ncbi:MAG: hypothetical protein FJ222_09995 [Lentisphaerae bacterium]|nr:hypothetical protein [Lentisphaerota bacterium]
MKPAKWWMNKTLGVAVTAVGALVGGGCLATNTGSVTPGIPPRDLTPVTHLETPQHAPVEIVRDGQARAVVYVADPSMREAVDPEFYRRKNAGTPPALARLIQELDTVIRIQTGAQLEHVAEPPPADQPAIIIGDCEESRQAGVAVQGLPPEGFIVQTAPHRVFLAARTQAGASWAVSDFLERFVGVRWYWRPEYGGRSIPKAASLAIPPAHYRDQPVFRQRFHFVDQPYLYPVHTEGHNNGDLMPLPLVPGLLADETGPMDPAIGYTPDLPLTRHGSSLDFQPGLIQGHAGMWGGLGALNEDGTRDKKWVCFSAPETLDAYLAQLEKHWNADGPVRAATHNIVTEGSCTVYFPRSPGMVCHCPLCARTAATFRDDQALRKALIETYGEQRAFEMIEERVHIRVFGFFLQRVCEAVKARWPDKKVVFRSGTMPPPEGVTFPDNFRVYAVWPDNKWSLGVEMHPSVGRGFEDRIRAWGVPVVTEGSISSPSDWAYAPVEYPHLVQDFYQRNTNTVLGSVLTIFCPKIWISSAPTYYVWHRVLWNPDLDVDATLDELCRRLFGPGAEAARALLRLHCDRWERTPLSRALTAEDRHREHLPGQSYGTGTLAQEWRLPDDLYREIWPPDVVARMKDLRDQALAAINQADDTDARRAFLYWTWTFDAFLEEAAAVHRKQPADFVRDAGGSPFLSADGLADDLALDIADGVQLKLTLIRPGEFLMGSATNSWGHHRSEAPQHRVRITQPFYLGIYEVTEAHYAAVTGTNPSQAGTNRPVGKVSWNDAMTFCRTLSEKTGRNVRLPTEAEWEYACRAGTTTPWSFGGLEQVANMGDYAWYAPQAKASTPHDVGGKQPNAWGLYDMHGNVSEWCLDRYAADTYAWTPTDDPSGPESGLFRVMRGGSCHNLWARNPEFARSSSRAYGHPDTRVSTVGFRIVMECGAHPR